MEYRKNIFQKHRNIEADSMVSMTHKETENHLDLLKLQHSDHHNYFWVVK